MPFSGTIAFEGESRVAVATRISGVIAETGITRLTLSDPRVCRTRDLVTRECNLPAELLEYTYHFTRDLLLGPVEHGQLAVGDYYNHSCQPNAGFRDSITLVAMTTIQPGEEVTFDYCMCMTSTILTLKCACGDTHCRKIIRGSDWKKLKLQTRYKDYFVPYIQDKIARQKR